MLRQLDRRCRARVLAVTALLALAMIGITAARGKALRSPECAQLARIVASRAHSLLDSQRFRKTELQAYSVCARDPAAFRKLIRIS